MLSTDEPAAGSDVLTAGSGVSPMFDELDALDLEIDSAAQSGISLKAPDLSGTSSPVHDETVPGSSAERAGVAASDVELADALDDASLGVTADAGTSDIMLGSDALKLEGSALSFEDNDELSLGEENLQLEGSQAGGSDIDLMGEVDDDLVLGGSSHGDLSRTGDSGISLLDPADSGISLESPPLELGGSSVEQLELGEEDELGLDTEPSPAKSAALSGIATPQSDDDFLLTPLEEAEGEESDSGSQVIALEGDVEFEEAGGVGRSRRWRGIAGGRSGRGLGRRGRPRWNRPVPQPPVERRPPRLPALADAAPEPAWADGTWRASCCARFS